jgi:hypothetical protein
VVALIDADRVVCSIQLPRVAEATPEVEEAETPDEPERIGGKKEEA